MRVIIHITNVRWRSILTTESGVTIWENLVFPFTIFDCNVLIITSLVEPHRVVILIFLSLTQLFSADHIWNSSFMMTTINFVIAHVGLELAIPQGLVRFLHFDRTLIRSLGACRKATGFYVFVGGIQLRFSMSLALNRGIFTDCFRSRMQRVTRLKSIAVLIGRHIFRDIPGVKRGPLLFGSKVVLVDIIECKLFLLSVLGGHRAELCSNSRRRNHLLVNSNGWISFGL